MRTRFLATDYFASQSLIETLRDFQFLSLPPPHLPSFDPPLGVEIPFFDVDFSFPSEIDGFPIENALSQFLSDVIPRLLPVGGEISADSSSGKRELHRFRSGSAEIGVSERRDDDFWKEENRESWECFSARADAVDEVVDFIHEEKAIEKSLDSVTKTPEIQRSKLRDELRFEIVELDLPLQRETMSSCEAEEVGFCLEIPNVKIPLKLTSMGIKFHEVRHAYSPAKQFGSLDNIEFTNSVLEGLLHFKCLLICHENVLPSFPFNKFSIILEYGGPYGSSRLSSICPNLDGLPQLHFFHVKLENHNLPASLCEGFVSQHPKSTMEAVSEFMPNLQRVLNSQHIVEILNFMPTEEKKTCVSSESENQVDVSHDIESVDVLYPMRSKNIESVMHSFPDVVIIVNTQSSKKKMLMSRRSSYQKILALEKGGVQVVEREIDLPLDLIFSAAICLVWYEAGSFRDNVSLKVETSSVAIFMENIATNILMSLSFAFSGCILIFEGGSDFLAAIMESSDALYAAAASLDINLQLFCSYMPESTDKIILNCIRNETKLGRSLYPAMPESETLGESFLTRFPSINPLSAHAILSSGGMLVEFLEWSNEQRIQAIGKYHVSDESITLFSTVCRYGEMGESKSVMTECSSVDSDINSGLLQSPRKRKRNASQTFSMPSNDFFCDVPLNETINEMKLPQAFQPYQLRKFSDIQNKLRKSEVHSLGKRQAGSTPMICNHDRDGKVGREHLNKDFSVEFIDHSYSLDEIFPCKSNSSSFLRRSGSRSEPAVRSSLPTSREAFDKNSHSTFPTSVEVNHDKNKWTSFEDENLTLDDKIFENTAINSKKNDIHLKQQDHLKEDFMQDRTRNILGLSTQERLQPLYGEIPYTSPNQSTRLQQVPGWTIELLHRVKKKSRGRQQTLSCNTCFNCTRSLKNKDPPSRSQSPSIFDSYRYRGNTQTKQTVKKWRKDIKVQLNSENGEKKSSLINPTWTPIDKRARQNLSFMRNGNEKQSKLVWRNRNSPITGGNLRKR